MVLHSSWTLPRRLAAAALLCLPLLLAQSKGYLSVGEISKVSGKRGEVIHAKIPLSVQPGYHVNSNHPSEDYLIPLKLTWTATGAMEAGEVVYPKPEMEKYDFSEKPLSVFTGNFDLTANFKVGTRAPAGPGAVAGKLRYQACSSKACYPPKDIEVTIPYQVQ